MSTRRALGRSSLAAVGVLALALTGCSAGGAAEGGGGEESAAPEAGGTLAAAQESGTITIAVADERPYSWIEGGEPKGATIAMHEQIFSSLGIDDLEVVEADWNSLIPGLNAGRFDVISAGMSILPERCAEAAFSDPEIMYTTALMVAEGNPHGLTDLASVVEAGDEVTLATLSGGIESGYAESLGIETTGVDNAQSGMDIVANGRADAFVAVIDGVEQIGAGATVFRQADTELLEAYNAELANITGDVDEYMSLVGEYGFTEENLPPADLTTEQLCAGELE